MILQECWPRRLHETKGFSKACKLCKEVVTFTTIHARDSDSLSLDLCVSLRRSKPRPERAPTPLGAIDSNPPTTSPDFTACPTAPHVAQASLVGDGRYSCRPRPRTCAQTERGRSPRHACGGEAACGKRAAQHLRDNNCPQNRGSHVDAARARSAPNEAQLASPTLDEARATGHDGFSRARTPYMSEVMDEGRDAAARAADSRIRPPEVCAEWTSPHSPLREAVQASPRPHASLGSRLIAAQRAAIDVPALAFAR